MGGGGVIEGMSMEPMEGGAGSPVCVCGEGGGSLRACPWNSWKVGLVISLCVQGGRDLIEGMSGKVGW